ncbi:MAG: flagellar protein FlaG [Lachnospiraceae bacterium]|nr:flagellar protein FlaG [Candidatus Colinaster equi]
MAIEPIGSMTAMQVQSTVRVQPIDTTSNVQNVDALATNSATPKLDDNTSVVAKTSESNTKGDNSNAKEQTEAELEYIKKAVSDMNKNFGNTEAVFGIHEGTNRVTIKLVDKETKELIKELPPEKTLDMIARVWEMAGILVDEKR